MNSDKKYLYKLTPSLEIKDKIFDTDEKIDKNQISRFDNLKPLFSKIYNFSLNKNLAIKEVLNKIYINKSLNINILIIKYILKKRNFY